MAKKSTTLGTLVGRINKANHELKMAQLAIPHDKYHGDPAYDAARKKAVAAQTRLTDAIALVEKSSDSEAKSWLAAGEFTCNMFSHRGAYHSPMDARIVGPTLGEAKAAQRLAVYLQDRVNASIKSMTKNPVTVGARDLPVHRHKWSSDSKTEYVIGFDLDVILENRVIEGVTLRGGGIHTLTRSLSIGTSTTITEKHVETLVKRFAKPVIERAVEYLRADEQRAKQEAEWKRQQDARKDLTDKFPKQGILDSLTYQWGNADRRLVTLSLTVEEIDRVAKLAHEIVADRAA